MTRGLKKPVELLDLARFSVRVGSDPLLIQAAGGNTSLKDGDVMWIKASGTLLAEAETRDIFVPVNLPAIRAALEDPELDADQTASFSLGGTTLRPSIETSLHAIFPQRVVVHVHCVNTLAHAVRREPEPLLDARLSGNNWCLVPYVKPGARLAKQVQNRLTPQTGVAVLTNHGIIVAGASVAEAETTLKHVVAALTIEPAPRLPVDIAALEDLASPGWQVPPADASVHQIALDPRRTAQATAGSLYPDHVIFCGVGAEAIDGALPESQTAPAFLLIPGKGAVARADASQGALALMNCLGDVLLRVPPEAELGYLTAEQNAELLDWDAEKYRQKLNA